MFPKTPGRASFLYILFVDICYSLSHNTLVSGAHSKTGKLGCWVAGKCTVYLFSGFHCVCFSHVLCCIYCMHVYDTLLKESI